MQGLWHLLSVEGRGHAEASQSEVDLGLGVKLRSRWHLFLTVSYTRMVGPPMVSVLCESL
jgi:hypothetical protein